MTAAEVEQLNVDLRNAFQLDVYALEKSKGLDFREASSFSGYRAFFRPDPGEFVIEKNEVNSYLWASKNHWVRPIDQIDSIDIWINFDGPSITWKRGEDNELRRAS